LGKMHGPKEDQGLNKLMTRSKKGGKRGEGGKKKGGKEKERARAGEKGGNWGALYLV